MPHVVRSYLRSECVADFVIDRAWEPSDYDVPTDTLQGITQPVDALPPSRANDMPTIRADAWKVGIKRWALRISLQSLESPWEVRFPPSLVNNPKRYMRRSEAICPSLPKTLNHARAVRDVLRHLDPDAADRQRRSEPFLCRSAHRSASATRARVVVSLCPLPRGLLA